MNVLFDQEIHWLYTPAHFAEGAKRTYAAAPLPYRFILIIRENIIDMIPSSLWHNHYSRIYDCSIGNHDGAKFPDHALPANVGYPHSKLTVRSQLPPDSHVDATLSALLAKAPTLHSDDPKKPTPGHLEPLTIPPALFEQAQRLADATFDNHWNALGRLTLEALWEYIQDRI